MSQNLHLQLMSARADAIAREAEERRRNRAERRARTFDPLRRGLRRR